MRNSFTKLVPVNNPEYLIWCRKFAREKRNKRANLIQISEEKNYDSFLKKEYRLWENSLQKIMGSYIKEHTNRILRFSSERRITSYRELDFIAEIDKSLLFCELKFRKHHETTKSSKISAAWKQVSKTHSIACHNYALLRPLFIFIDMSFVFEIDYKNDKRPINSESIKNLEYIFNKIEKHVPNFIWFDSYEIFKEALDKKVLKHEDLIRFRSIYKDSENEKLRESDSFSSEYKIDVSNPFSVLRKPRK